MTKCTHCGATVLTSAEGGEALTDMQAHCASWRRALQLARAMAAPSGVDHDDAAFWDHEIAVFDSTAPGGFAPRSRTFDTPAVGGEAVLKTSGLNDVNETTANYVRLKELEPASPLRGNYEERHPNDMVLHPLSEIREWDEALAVLGIQNSDQTPAEAIRELNDELERLRDAALFASPTEQPVAPLPGQIEHTDGSGPVLIQPAPPWQPIDTIPQDRPVDGWHKAWKCPVTIACRSWGDRNAWIEKTLTTEWPIEAFTHWRETSTAPDQETT